MERNTVKRYSLTKQVSDRLESMIEDGTFEIGSKIPTESELMESFNVSRNTLREAIHSLTSAGILEVRQGDGTYVISNNRFDANMSMKLENVSYNKVNEARKTLEVSIASYAASRRTEKDLINIKSALDKRQVSQGSEKENTILDVTFHMEIAKACHNEVLLLLYKSLYTFLVSNIEKRKLKSSGDQTAIDQYHEDLVMAIEKGDPEEAEFYAKKILKM